MFAATLVKWGHGRHNESSNDRNFEAGNNGLNHKACRIAESKPQLLQIIENQTKCAHLALNCLILKCYEPSEPRLFSKKR